MCTGGLESSWQGIGVEKIAPPYHNGGVPCVEITSTALDRSKDHATAFSTWNPLKIAFAGPFELAGLGFLCVQILSIYIILYLKELI